MDGVVCAGCLTWMCLHDGAAAAYRAKRRKTKEFFADVTGEAVETVVQKLLSTDRPASRSPALARLVDVMLASSDGSVGSDQLGVKVLPERT